MREVGWEVRGDVGEEGVMGGGGAGGGVVLIAGVVVVVGFGGEGVEIGRLVGG